MSKSPKENGQSRFSLGGEWSVRPDPEDVGLRERWPASPGDQASWVPGLVPNWWGPRSHRGPIWYRRGLDNIPLDGSRPLGVCLQGVDETVRVWANGRPLAVVAGGHRRYAFGIDNAPEQGRLELAIRVVDDGAYGRTIGEAYCGSYERPEDLLQGVHHGCPARPSAEWVRDAVIYQVYLRSFSPEGTFAGLEQRLDELRKLGVSVLWLMPIHPVGRVRRKGTLGSPYAVQDYYAVNPEFGTMDGFGALLRAVHRLDMKLILDLVANHTAWDCSLISEHPDWYERDGRGNIRAPVADWPDVAQLDFSNPQVRGYMTDVMLHWVSDMGIDGFRCDVAGMVPLDFWEDARRRLEEVKPVLMLAEDDQPAQHLAAFDMTYDWATPSLLTHLPGGHLPPIELSGVLADEVLDFPTGGLRMRFSSNHDLCAWELPVMQRFGPEAARAAAVLTFVMPGVPLIYNGQEVGNRRELHLFERVPVDWSDDPHDMRALYTELAELRRRRISLRCGQTEVIPLPADTGVFALRRHTPAEDTCALINLTPLPRSVNSGGGLPVGPSTLFGNATLQRGGDGWRIDLPPRGYWIGGADS